MFDHVALEVASAAPFGLLWWRKTVVVALPRPLHVGPRLGRPLPLPRGREDTTGGGELDSAVQIGVPRGVRPYRPGDQRRWVHWPATAHSGELMVREMEGPTAEPVTLEVRLPADPDAAEAVAEQAMGTVVALVDRGASVLLATTEATGPHASGPWATGAAPAGAWPAPWPNRARAGAAARRWSRPEHDEGPRRRPTGQPARDLPSTRSCCAPRARAR